MGTLTIIIATGIVLWVTAPWVIPAIFGADFAPAVLVLRILLLSVVGMTMAHVMASQWIGRGLFLQAGLITFITGIVTVIGHCVFVPRYAMAGAAWVTVGTSVVSIAVNGIVALRIQRRSCRSDELPHNVQGPAV